MKYQLVYFPNDNLYKETSSVTKFDEDLFELLDAMKTIMIDNKGLGISSNQVGGTVSCFLLRQINGDIIEIINPDNMEHDGIQLFNEGCLSVPGVFVTTNRSKEVKFIYQNRYGENKQGIVEGLEAIIFQHELGHLFGDAFYDHTTRQQRKAALRKLGIK